MTYACRQPSPLPNAIAMPVSATKGDKTKAASQKPDTKPETSVTDSRVVERNTDGTAMMSVVLPDDALAAELPKPSIVVRAGCHEIGRVGAEGAVPDPALMAMQRRFKGKGMRIAVGREIVLCGGVVRLRCVERPDTGGVVGRAGRKIDRKSVV